MKRHYHVGSNTPGYLPESDPYTFTNRRDAERAATEMKQFYLESTDSTRASGSARSGRIDISDSGKMYDLGTVIWISPCEYPINQCESGEIEHAHM